MLRRFAILVLLTLAASPVPAQDAPRSVEECERLEGFDAYNRCLARFGPRANAIGAGTARPPRGADPEAEPATPAASGPSRPSAGARTPSRPAAAARAASRSASGRTTASRSAAARPAPARRAAVERRVRGGRQSATFEVVTGRRPRPVPPSRPSSRPARPRR